MEEAKPNQYEGNVVPFNEQRANYEGSQASGAKGKPRPTKE